MTRDQTQLPKRRLQRRERLARAERSHREPHPRRHRGEAPQRFRHSGDRSTVCALRTFQGVGIFDDSCQSPRKALQLFAEVVTTTIHNISRRIQLARGARGVWRLLGATALAPCLQARGGRAWFRLAALAQPAGRELRSCNGREGRHALNQRGGPGLPHRGTQPCPENIKNPRR